MNDGSGKAYTPRMDDGVLFESCFVLPRNEIRWFSKEVSGNKSEGPQPPGCGLVPVHGLSGTGPH